MNIKNLLILLIVVFLSSGCSSINTTKYTASEAIPNFLTDILANFQDEDEDEDEDEKEGAITDYVAEIKKEGKEIDPVLKATHALLEATPEWQPDDIQRQMDEHFANTLSKVNVNTSDNTNDSVNVNVRVSTSENDVWAFLTTFYQFSAEDNKRINSQKKWFIKHKSEIKKISKRAEPYLYFIAKEVKKRNMPGEIALLPIIESSFRADASSHKSASGLWQFMPATGRYLNLKQNSWYDGRRDIYKSTLAALTYLEQLHKYYDNDWLLALAAYNIGVGKLNRAIRKNLKKGKAIDYWSLSLPKETYTYVPKLIAVSKVIQNHKTNGVSLTIIKNKPYLALVDVHSQIELSVAAKIAGISVDKMRSYNPAFKRLATDPNGPHHLLIPIKKVNNFKIQLASLGRTGRIKGHKHTIRSGESLGVIAQNYGLSVAQLKDTNNLSNNRIRAGKSLMIPLADVEKISASEESLQLANSSKQAKQKDNSDVTYYTVRNGDSFWLIARRYKVSHKRLAEFNNFSAGDRLSIGQTVLIPNDSILKNKEIYYKVKSGDSLSTIALQFKVSIRELKRWNHLNSKKHLQPGQKIKLFVASKQS